jgi:hypothetical protein
MSEQGLKHKISDTPESLCDQIAYLAARSTEKPPLDFSFAKAVAPAR